MSDKVIVEITHPKNVNFGRKIYGSGAQYPVDQATAAGLVRNGKAKVVKGKLVEETIFDTPGRLTNQEFMTFVKRNAREILGILHAESENTNIELEVPASSESTEAPETSDESSESSDDTEEEDESEPVVDSEVNEPSNDIPEDFPGREVLAKAGITTLDQIPRDREKLMEIDQMTGRVANQIGVKLGE